MLKNYSVNEDGVIFQKEKSLFNYDVEYIRKSYDSYGIITEHMSYLRLGYVIRSCDIKLTTLLDVGYGNGSFLKVASKVIPNCFGYEVNNYPIPDGVQFVNDWMNNSYDVITFFDVLEHFPDPYIIKNSKTKYIVISLPWCHYNSDDWFYSWKHRRENEHLWFFNENSMKNFANSCGFTMTHYCNMEDVIRVPLNNSNTPNILTVCLRNNSFN